MFKNSIKTEVSQVIINGNTGKATINNGDEEDEKKGVDDDDDNDNSKKTGA